MPVDVVGAHPGDAAGLKLLRSVFMKGVAAAAIESLEAAKLAGAEERVHADIAGVIGEELLERFLSGSRTHAARRVDEMNAAAAYVEELGVEPRIASAAAAWLEQLRDEGQPLSASGARGGSTPRSRSSFTHPRPRACELGVMTRHPQARSSNMVELGIKRTRVPRWAARAEGT